MSSERSSSQAGVRRLMGRSVLLVAGAAVALALAACGRAAPASGDVRMGAADGDAVEVVAVDNEFEPAAVEVAAGDEVTIQVTNDGGAPHNFVIEELDLSTGTLEPGDVATATFVAPDASVHFVCTFHPGMEGEIRVATG